MADKLPITRPAFDGSEAEAVRRVLESGWVVQGPRVQAFEASFAAFTGIPHAIATTSCTTALHMALLASGIRAGDSVIVPAFTFVATANAVEYLGARPLFCDVDLDTFNLDPTALAAAVRPGTRGAIPVHLFGLACDVDAVQTVARKDGLTVIEDAACAIGASYGGAHVGGFGRFGCFSFHPRKAITTGEGGMISTRDAATVARLRSLRDHGAAKSDLSRHAGGGVLLPEFDDLGYNYRMTDLQAAIGVEQMRKLPDLLARRRRWAARYDELLAGVPWLRTPRVPAGREHGYQAYVLRVVQPDTGRADVADVERLAAFRERIMVELEAEGISTRQGTHAVHLLGLYRNKYGLRPADYPNAWLADRTTLALPLFAQMEATDLERVRDRLLAAGGRALGLLRPVAIAAGPPVGEVRATAPTASLGTTPRVEVRSRPRLLLTGGTGFIGRHFLADYAVDFDCTALVRVEPAAKAAGVRYRVQDLCRPLEAAHLPERVEAVVHLAQSTRYRQIPDAADDVIRVNVASTLGLVEWARRTGCPHFVFASTAGFNAPGVERADDEAAIVPDSFYANTKEIAESLLREYAAHLTLTVVRPYTIYGPGQEARMLPNLADQVAAGRTVFLEGSERGMLLSPLHVRDAARALCRILDARPGGSVNLAGDEVVSVREIALLAGEAAGTTPRFEIHADKPARTLVGKNARMKGLLGGSPLLPFRAGFLEMARSRAARRG